MESEAELRQAMARHARALLSYADRKADHVLGARVCEVLDWLAQYHAPDETGN